MCILYVVCVSADKETWDGLQQRLDRSTYDGVIRDIYDGESYQEHFPGFLSKPTNISLLLNTDGVAIFNSSKVSIWPVWIQINELPKCQRYFLCVLHLLS